MAGWHGWQPARQPRQAGSLRATAGRHRSVAGVGMPRQGSLRSRRRAITPRDDAPEGPYEITPANLVAEFEAERVVPPGLAMRTARPWEHIVAHANCPTSHSVVMSAVPSTNSSTTGGRTLFLRRAGSPPHRQTHPPTNIIRQHVSAELSLWTAHPRFSLLEPLRRHYRYAKYRTAHQWIALRSTPPGRYAEAPPAECRGP